MSLCGVVLVHAQGASGKKWIYPVLWVILVLWFLRTTYVSRQPGAGPVDNVVSTKPKIAKEHNTSPPVHYEANPFATADVNTSIKAAVIIETRQTAAFIPLVLHFSAVLGPDWPIIIYSSEENFGSFTTSDALRRYRKSGRIIVRPLADGLYFPDWAAVSEFVTEPWLWEDLAPAEHILMFQTDSILCANAARSVEDFFEWDFIGAPIVKQYGEGFNGGLSLRKRSTVLRVLEEFTWLDDPGHGPEDQWYYARMKELQERDEGAGVVENTIKLPSMEIARTFAVESIDYPHPLGLHQPTRFIQPDTRTLPLDEWCPEYKLASNGED